jgi:MoaA/NifB/PqqE/SkfB family radical SAM enzyme
MKRRLGPDGLHLFDRRSGWNLLLEEVQSTPSDWSPAPRQVSIALTNVCDLQCAYCYAPKNRSMLEAESVAEWLTELDQAGSLGVGFGGGEPTLHPEFPQLCAHARRKTKLAVTFTTHGHRLNTSLLNRLDGNIDFIRVSVDGVKETYERNRKRSFASLVSRLREARGHSQVGLNVVVNEETILDLDEIAALAQDVDASEILLLPQRPTSTVAKAGNEVRADLSDWIARYGGSVRLAISEEASLGFPTCNPLPLEVELRAYAHISADARVKRSSFDDEGVLIDASGILAAVKKLGQIERGVL